MATKAGGIRKVQPEGCEMLFGRVQMAIESGSWFRRMARAACLGLFSALSLCGAAAAQVPVTAGSVIPFQHPVWGQIYQIVIAKNGSVLYLDAQNGALYQLSPGASTPITVSAAGAVLKGSSNFWNESMVLDGNDTLYIADRYDSSVHFFRVPYDPKTGTWDLASSSVWQTGLGGGLNTNGLAFLNSSKGDGSGTLIISTETSPSILSVPVDGSGNPGTLTTVISGLQDVANKIAIDGAGNIIFTEGPYDPVGKKAPGVLVIPAGKTGLKGDGSGSIESGLTRLDPPADNYKFNGVTLDTAGNLYLTSEVDGYGGNFNGVLMVPNESGSLTSATPSSYNFSHAVMIAPISSGAPLAVDPRGFLWIPTGTGGWTPSGELVYPGTLNVVQWQLGSASIGATPVGTPSTAGTVFYSFSTEVTPAQIGFSRAGSTAVFAATPTDPNPDPSVTPAQAACTAGKPYLAFTSCPVWITANPTLPGAASAELQLRDASGSVIAGSNTFVNAVGQGAGISVLVPSAEAPRSTGLSAPKQVAGDALGNSYVADSGLGKVLMFPAGSASAAAGVSVGSGLASPTGVAVDGSGNLYIGDSGKVFMVPFVAGALNTAGQTTIASGLGNSLNLAVDGGGDVYVADASNGHVLKIANAATESILANANTVVGSGFTAPSAVAVDDAGNVFVADGANLTKFNSYAGQTGVTSTLAAPVTGIAVDASGSVYVAQKGGVLRIPSLGGNLTVNSAASLATDITSPSGVGLDGFGNTYVTSGAGATAALTQVGIGGSLNFGQTAVGSENDSNVGVFNIGNANLTFPSAPAFGGANGADFGPATADLNQCDTTGATPVGAGAYCEYGLELTASAVGVENGTAAITSNAANAATVTVAMTGTGEDNLPTTTTTVALSPATGLSYPASTTVTVTVKQNGGTAAPTGNVSLVLENPVAKTAQILPPVSLKGTTVTFSLTNLNGGSYNLQAKYTGDVNFAGSQAKTTLTVAQAVPTVTTSTPAAYVLLGSSGTITATVTSSKGTPTGTITFMQGSKPADPAQVNLPLNGSGSVTFNTSNLANGSYSLVAVYSGDQNFAKVSSAPVPFQNIPQSVLITATPAAATLTAGVASQVSLNLQSLVGFAKTVGVACDNTTLPQYSECTFDNPNVVVPNGGAATVVVTISTNVPVNVARLQSHGLDRSSLAFAGVFSFGLLSLLFGGKTRFDGRALKMLCLTLLLMGASVGVTACSNSGYTQTPPAPHVTTPSGTYNVRIVTTDPSANNAVVSLPFTIGVTVQ